MTGKTCLITGATSGIGAVTARTLALMGARVLVVGRDAGKVERMVEDLRCDSGISRHQGFTADLSSQAELRRLAHEVKAATTQLDVLINNAGAMSFERQETADGFEHTFALNHLAYFTLTNLLEDLLRRSAPSRIVNVASDAHRGAKGIWFDDLQARRRYQGWAAYCHSKLANVLFTRELARRLHPSNVTANCLHPGFVKTHFFVKPGFRWWLMGQAARVLAISPEEGAKTTIHLAAGPVDDDTGMYFAKSAAVQPSKAALDDEAARKLWEKSAELTNLG